MNYQEAYAKLEKWGQTHVLKHYDALSDEQKNMLLEQIAETDFSVVESCKYKEELNKKGEISPLAAMELPEIEANAQSFAQTGLEAIKQGKVGAVLLAGGMGTRLGSSHVAPPSLESMVKDLPFFSVSGRLFHFFVSAAFCSAVTLSCHLVQVGSVFSK